MEMTFRTAAFGGFHRQDVTDYIANMAKENSDRVAALGEDVRRAAEEKFQQINNAKEKIYKARGMK